MIVKAPNHPIHLIHPAGCSAYLAPGESRELPGLFHQLALEHGCEILDGSDGSAPAGSDAPELVVDEALKAAIMKLKEDNVLDAFRQDGRPRVGAVRELVGADVTVQQVNAAYDELIDEGRFGTE